VNIKPDETLEKTCARKNCNGCPFCETFVKEPVTSTEQVCFQYEYGDEFSQRFGVSAVFEMPQHHPTVTRPAGIRACTTHLHAGDPIPSKGYWHYEGCESEVSGADLFYAYSFPDKASANTGYSTKDALTMYFVRDVSGSISLLMTAGKVGGKKGKLHLSATSTGLAGTGVQVIRGDDAHEVAWNDADGTGTFNWEWYSCCTDGAVIGPLPAEGFTMTFVATDEMVNMERVLLASYDGSKKDLAFRDLSVDRAFGEGRGVRVSAFKCSRYCERIQTCGECTASEMCGWCSATQTCSFHDSTDVTAGSSCPSSYTPPGQCCSECSSQQTRGLPRYSWLRLPLR
jgi:hypothetical protein